MSGIQTRGEKVFAVFNYCMMIMICVITIYPLWHIVMASVSDPVLVVRHRGFFPWPLGNLHFKGYRLVIENPNIATGFANTFFYVTIGTTLGMFVTILGAYALSRKGTLWNRPIMLIIVFTMYFQGGSYPSILWCGT